MLNWQERTLLCIGSEGLNKLNNSTVVVIGLGGVGAYAAEMLCRAGIGSMTIADADVVHSTNRNRQLLALTSTEGKKKVDLMAQRLLDINPSLKLQVYDEYLKDEAMINVLKSNKFDYVVDAIDTLSPKVYLIYHAVRMGLKVVSSMGSGAKLKPECVKIADISQSYQCPFAYDLRKRLRRLGINSGVKVVFSDEPVIKTAVVHNEEEKNKKSITGTISYMPAVFGCFIASVVIRELLNIDL